MWRKYSTKSNNNKTHQETNQMMSRKQQHGSSTRAWAESLCYELQGKRVQAETHFLRIRGLLYLLLDIVSSFALPSGLSLFFFCLTIFQYLFFSYLSVCLSVVRVFVSLKRVTYFPFLFFGLFLLSSCVHCHNIFPWKCLISTKTLSLYSHIFQAQNQTRDLSIRMNCGNKYTTTTKWPIKSRVIHSPKGII